jgi:hypothetical protein
MGYRAWPIAAGWTADVRSMLAALDEPGTHIIRVRCLLCRKSRALTRRDLERIADQRGEAYSLLNKRTRCRLKTGCTGWNVFGWSHGTWVYPLFTEAQDQRWSAHDAKREEIGRRHAVDLLRSAGRERAEKRARERR